MNHLRSNHKSQSYKIVIRNSISIHTSIHIRQMDFFAFLINVLHKHLGPVVQSVVSLTSSLRVISSTVLADSIYNILIFFAEKMWVAFSYSHFFSKKFQHICVSLDVNFNESLTNDVVSFEQLGPVSQVYLIRNPNQTASNFNTLNFYGLKLSPFERLFI